MKRITSIAIAISAVLMTGTLVAQQGPGMGRRMEGGPMMQSGQMQGPRGGAMMGGLDLTDEQRAKVEDLMTQHQREAIAVHAQLQKLQADLKLEITTDKYDAGKVKGIQSEISKLTSEMMSKRIGHQRAVRDLLTPEQRKQFDRHILAGPQGGQFRRGGFGGPMQGGQGMMRGMRQRREF
ncbi:MAG: Spy/CpxP family protein refolding chaperone [Bacteroidota bacterium]